MPPMRRIFLAGPPGPDSVTVFNLTPELDKAMDVLHAAGMLNDKSVPLLIAAERDDRDVVKFAHHLVGLASAVRR